MAICGAQYVVWLTKIAGVIGAYFCGCYNVYRICFDSDFTKPDNYRWLIVYIYLVVFCLAIIVAELGLLKHRVFSKFGKFLTSFSGRGLIYLFVGGLMFDRNDNNYYNYIPGIYMILIAVFNIIIQCAFKKKYEAYLKGETLDEIEYDEQEDDGKSKKKKKKTNKKRKNSINDGSDEDGTYY